MGQEHHAVVIDIENELLVDRQRAETSSKLKTVLAKRGFSPSGSSTMRMTYSSSE